MKSNTFSNMRDSPQWLTWRMRFAADVIAEVVHHRVEEDQDHVTTPVAYTPAALRNLADEWDQKR